LNLYLNRGSLFKYNFIDIGIVSGHNSVPYIMCPVDLSGGYNQGSWEIDFALFKKTTARLAYPFE